jgi:hypothetical protein
MIRIALLVFLFVLLPAWMWFFLHVRRRTDKLTDRGRLRGLRAAGRCGLWFALFARSLLMTLAVASSRWLTHRLRVRN